MYKSSLLFLLFMLSGCTNVKFETPMPTEANRLYSFPCSFIGEYLEVQHTQHSILGTFYTTSQDSTSSYIIKERDAIRIDSVNWTNHNLDLIEGFEAEHDHIKIFTKSKIHRWYYSDSIQTNTSKVAYEINLIEGLSFAGNREEKSNYASECQLLEKEGKYYLNTNPDTNTWEVLQLTNKSDRILISNVVFDDRKMKIAHRVSKDSLLKYGLNRRSYPEDFYRGYSSNKQMEALISRNRHNTLTWHKIDARRYNWATIPYGLLLILLSLVFLKLVLR